MGELVTALDDLVQQTACMTSAYRPACEKFTQYLRGQGTQPSLRTVREYFSALTLSPLSSSTVRVHRCAIKRLLRGMVGDADRDELERFFARIDKEPETKAPKAAPRSVGLEKIIQPDEYERLLLRSSPRLSLVLRFLHSTGCRVSELTGARLDRCREVLPGFVDVLVRGKGSKDRTVSIRREHFDEIRGMFDGREYLFETKHHRQLNPVFVSRCVRRLGRRVLHRTISAHCFRHSYATIQIMRTGKTGEVSRYLGHSSVSTTLQMYVHRDFSREEAVLA